MPRSRSPIRDRNSSSYRSYRTSSKDDYRSSSTKYDSRDRRDSGRRRERSERDQDRYRDKDYSRYKERDSGKDRDSRPRRSRDYDRDYARSRHRSRSPRSERSRYSEESSRKSTPESSRKPATEAPKREESTGLSNSTPEVTINGTNQSIRDSKVENVSTKIDRSIGSGNASSSATPETETPKGISLDEEKKRKRMERLEQWKLKKAQEKAQAEAASHEASPRTPSASIASPPTVPKGSNVSTAISGTDVKLTDTDSSVKRNIMKPLSMFKPAISTKPKFGLGKPIEKPKVSLGFEDSAKPKPAKPPGSNRDKPEPLDQDIDMKDADDEEIDPLDAFMSTIEADTSQTPQGTVTSLPSLVMSEDIDTQQTDELADDEENTNPEEFMAQLEKKKRKDIPVVDHSKINYEPFRKQFYYEPPELTAMSNEDADMLRLELDGIKIRGINCPKPVLKWAQFGLPVPTMNVINNLGYEKPTSIQAQAIPAIMSGRDVIGVAKTGSGKTMAFLLPLFRQIKDQRSLLSHEGPMALVMTPTRELAVQIYRECRPFLKALDLRAVCAYGGSPIKDQIADLKRGAEIVVCTPGRMIDLLAANSGRVINLQRVTYLVLDEADRMFDMGFEPQVMKIIRNIRPDKQTVLFSATFPRQMETLARKTLKNAVEIIVGARSVVAPEITQIVEVRPEVTKFTRLLELLGEFYNTTPDARVLIFVDRQESADLLLKDLMARGYPCLSIHGGKDQIDRDSAIADFKSGVTSMLIATSVAARGLDVKQLKLVVNYDAPNHMEDYVHRVGRTGRAGNTGTAVTFVGPDQERSAVDIAKALRLSKVDVPESLQKMADAFLEKVKQGKERFGSGFGGKGLERLDEARDTARKRERKAYGEQDTTESATNGADEDDDMLGEAAIPSEETTSLSNGSGINDATASLYSISPTVVTQGHHSSTLEKMSKRNGVLRAGAAPDNHGPDTSAFHTTLEINDYPQKARWAVTNNANITKIIEANSTSITTKGQFYAPGKTPAEGEEPKLYLLIEGQTEVSVANARKGLAALLISGMEQAAQSESRAPAGRYTIK